jgi:condensin-2 complex subunit H2
MIDFTNLNLLPLTSYYMPSQDKNPPFDIGSYGEQILDTLSSTTDNTRIASFGEIVSGKPKYEVARTFSALLQLVTTFSPTNSIIVRRLHHFSALFLFQVNDRSVDLDKGQVTNELVCYTADNPFHVKLIGSNRRPEMEAHFSRKRVKSPLQNCGKASSDSLLSLSQQKSSKKQSSRSGKVKTAIRLTPDGKRRRRSAQLMQPLNLESSR